MKQKPVHKFTGGYTGYPGYPYPKVSCGEVHPWGNIIGSFSWTPVTCKKCLYWKGESDHDNA